MQWFAALGDGAIKVAIGPHGSATPGPTLRKLNCDVVLRGEPDQTLARTCQQAVGRTFSAAASPAPTALCT